MITHVIWDLGDTLVNPPYGGHDTKPIDRCEEVQLRPYAEEVLREVAALGLGQAVLSNTATSDSDSVTRLLERLGVAAWFSFVYGTESEFNRRNPGKPSPEVFQRVRNALGVAPGQVVMVGNSWDHDVLGANGSEMHAIWLCNPDISKRADWVTKVDSPPFVLPVWDLKHVTPAIQLLQAALSAS
ncbi:HAD hydrolase-like protein [Alicyclobacillus cycloheptanicus]|uniref:FMN phosphatase YigB (HAD superfamily) n=1 Tax=Alicyclobacillus cycloheptanicus TaxID=1457 RepID=A0ABT9XKH0_9BACL|nr:HAD family hydrolase [Alicyclobacillus cycloheptanicus]MDQ0190799.1 FMN phosphatase YigB (HAD superfamily) [Alicyclobacillus cycloheptanicus]WDM02719.1 HAD hydrolase-like protein [Alicyclobacillus cycloheptanicus]